MLSIGRQRQCEARKLNYLWMHGGLTEVHDLLSNNLLMSLFLRKLFHYGLLIKRQGLTLIQGDPKATQRRIES